MKISRTLIPFSIGMFLLSSLFVAGIIATENTPEPKPTPTEANGGIIGTGVDELRCPKNLSGVGPTWNQITVGVSSIEDLSQFFDQEERFVTPYQPYYAGDFAPNFEFGTHEFGTVYACAVGGRVAALLIDRHAVSNSYVPMTVAQWVSFLGRPTLVSWHQQINVRMLHWPQYGTSIAVDIPDGLTTYADTEWLYLYPFRGTNYEELWPLNSVWKVQPFAEEMPEVELEVLDFEAIELTVTAEALWPTVTPRTPETQSFSPKPSVTAAP